MVSRLISLGLVFSLASSVSAGSSADRRAPHPQPAVYQSRQLTRDKLLVQRQHKERVRRGELRPRASDKVYPQCSTATIEGYAVFPGYTYAGNDMAGGPFGPFVESLCSERCAATTGCVGYYFNGNNDCPCDMKVVATDNAGLVYDQDAADAGAETAFLGSCASVAQYFTADKMNDCCDSYNKYPTCSVTTLPGWARLSQWDYLGDDLDGNPRTADTEEDCLNMCTDENNDNGDCASVFYWASLKRCYLKYSSGDGPIFSSTSEAAQDPGSAFDAMGTCNYLANEVGDYGQGPDGFMSDCCNSK